MNTTSDVLLRTENLSLSYGRLRAVNRLDLAIREGEIYGFLGRNGAGKTSTIRMLMGLIRPDGGRVELLRHPGRRIGTKQKQRIGYVSQEQHFYPWMTCQALGNFVSGFYPTWDQSEFNRLLRVLDLPPRRKAGHLSGGMQVKLALALALAYRPPILILDEPTAGLDPLARREFLDIIDRQARSQNRTTFFSSHLIDEVERIADRVGILHKGELCYDGDISTLQASIRRVCYSASPEESAAEATHEPVNDPLDLEPDDSTHEPVNDPETDDRPGPARFIADAQARGFTVLRDDFAEESSLILRGDPADWDRLSGDDWSVHQLSLEDIFISLTGEERSQI